MIYKCFAFKEGFERKVYLTPQNSKTMNDYYQSLIQALQFLPEYAHPSSYRVTHRLETVNELLNFQEAYNLFLLDRDCTLQGYHQCDRVPEFEDTLRGIATKAEIVSNSSFDEFQRIGDIFGDVLPVSKVVQLAATNPINVYVLRLAQNGLSVLSYNPLKREVTDESMFHKKGKEN